MTEQLLLNPGPVPVPESIRAPMADQLISHRSTAFEATYERAHDGLEYVFTHSSLDGSTTTRAGEVLILNGTATMAMEAAIANLVDRDGSVVTIENGKFGRRFARIADRHCDDLTRVQAAWGDSFDLDEIERAIDDSTALVTMVHSETSTGLTNPVEAVGRLADEVDATFVVDGVSSIGGDTFHVDDWHVDIAITDAQKALAVPPGISAMYLSAGAIERIDGSNAPFYEDLDWHLDKVVDNQTPFTSTIPQIRSLAVAVEHIEAEGMPARIDRHRRQALAYRRGFQAMGLSLFPNPTDETTYSNTVTAVSLPSPVKGDMEPFTRALADRHVSLAGGQAHLGGQIFRVSNMGWFEDGDIVRAVRLIGQALEEVGAEIDVKEGVEATEASLS